MQLIKLYFDDWDGNRECLYFETKTSISLIKEQLKNYKNEIIDYNFQEFIEYLVHKGIDVNIPNIYDVEF